MVKIYSFIKRFLILLTFIIFFILEGVNSPLILASNCPAIANKNYLNPSSFAPSISNSPPNEGVANAFDCNIGTKYLNFSMNSTSNSTAGVTIDYGSGKIVTSVMFTTANDSDERDPTVFRIYGSNTSGTSWSHQSWTLIAQNLSTHLPSSRYSNGQQISISNSVSYRYYKIEFTGLRNRSLANSVQVSRIMLYEDGNSEIRFNTQVPGLTAPATISQLAGTSISPTTLPAISRIGYTFNGWFTAPSGGALLSQLPATMPSGVTNYYAQWTANQYLVSFEANGGQNFNTSPQPVIFHQSYGTLPTISREGYRFDGWFNLSFGGSSVFSNTIVNTASNHTLTAQ
jgi:uncharacterized repeat protein (TIGR02543 family)